MLWYHCVSLATSAVIRSKRFQAPFPEAVGDRPSFSRDSGARVPGLLSSEGSTSISEAL